MAAVVCLPFQVPRPLHPVRGNHNNQDHHDHPPLTKGATIMVLFMVVVGLQFQRPPPERGEAPGTTSPPPSAVHQPIGTTDQAHFFLQLFVSFGPDLSFGNPSGQQTNFSEQIFFATSFTSPPPSAVHQPIRATDQRFQAKFLQFFYASWFFFLKPIFICNNQSQCLAANPNEIFRAHKKYCHTQFSICI